MIRDEYISAFDGGTGVSFNRREIIIPFFKVGVPEIDLQAIWESFKDFRTV